MPELNVAVIVALTWIEPRFLSVGGAGKFAAFVITSTVTGRSMPAGIIAGNVAGLTI